MSANTAEQRQLAPAYVSFPTFSNFVARLKEEHFPDQIDRSLMHGLSGGTQGHLMATLKFLGLIEDDGEVTSQFKALADAHGSPEWKSELKAVIDSAYSSTLQGIDILKTTPKQLRDKFREAGADGATNEKAVRFYLRALRDCEVKYPRFLVHSQRRTNGSSPRTGESRKRSNLAAAASGQGTKEDHSSGKSTLPPGTIAIPIPTRTSAGRVMIVPADLTEDDCELIESIIRALAKRMQKE